MNTTTSRLMAQLADLGIDADVDAPAARNGARRGVLHLARGASGETFEFVEGPDVRLASVRPVRSTQPLFVHTPHVAPKTRDAFRRAGVQYLDDAGNAWIQFGDVLIDVRGRTRQEGGNSRPRASGNLFSSGRAQVVLALLAWPDLWNAPQRDVAHAAGVSLGQAHNTLVLLAHADYGAKSRPTGRSDLLDLWAAAFPSGLAQRLMLARFRGDVGPVEAAGDEVALSGEAAVPNMLKAATLTLYVATLSPRLAIVNRWRADGEPNIVVRRKFWNDPDVAGAAVPRIVGAPWPLIYADLLASVDPRARAVAHQWREQHEQPR